MIAEFWNSLFGDAGFEPARTDHLEGRTLSDLLPYRVYDPEKDLYFTDTGMGFIVEIEPQVSTAETASNLHSAIMTAMPSSAGLQVINWSSPDIDSRLGRWALARSEGSDVVEAMSARRIGYLSDRRYGVEHAVKAVPLNRRVLIAGWIEDESGMAAQARLLEFKKAILTATGQHGHGPFVPARLIQFLEEVFQAADWGDPGRALYTSQLPINLQVPGATLKVGPDHMELGCTPGVAMTAATVSRYPREWDDAMGFMLFGDPDRIADRPHGPVLTCLSATAIPAMKASGDMVTARAKMQHAQKTGFAKFVSDFAGKEAEFAGLAEELQRGERLFQTVLGVVAFCRGGREETRLAGSELAKIYRRVGLSLRPEKYLQLPVLMSALPLCMSEAHMKVFRKMQRMRLLKGKAVAALMPISGEWKGNSDGPGILLLGRQGQVFTWSNFVSEGNYNVAVVGKSGAGKSVFMQEMVNSVYANGGRVLVIDDGYSFKTSCEILGGKHIAFDGSVRLKLNPFTMLQADKMETPEYAAEAIELVTRVIGSMAALGEQREGRVIGIEEQAITTAVKSVWLEKQGAGEITDVYERLMDLAATDPRLVDVCARLEAFTRGGTYGGYFEGASNVSVESAFTVVELSDIKSQPVLQEVVLQIVMFLGTELMYKTDRSVPVVILIDEAWDMLKGHGTAKFLEGVVRRARKYTGALITGTQSVDDYYGNIAAEVCLQNSDWLVMLAQKPETIQRLERDQKLAVAPGFGTHLKTITTVPGQFSELAIKGPSGWAFGRLLLDPYSLAVFSSKGATVQHLRRRQEAGMSTADALADMVAKGEVA